MTWLVGVVFFISAGFQASGADLEAARAAMEAKDWRQAVQHLTAYLKEDPESLEA